MKIIWWYVAAVNGDEAVGEGEEQFKATWFRFNDALSRLTFESDRDILREAIRIVEENGLE